MKYYLSKELILVGVLITILLNESKAEAVTLIKVGGGVTLSDGESPAGTKVTLKADLDRDGKYAKFERQSATVNDNGVYSVDISLSISSVSIDMVSYITQFLSDFESGGFESLIEAGPMSVILVFEKQGYSKVVKSLSTNLMEFSVSAQLTPLEKIFCEDGECGAADGSVIIEEFLGGKGIASGYTKAYDPTLDTNRFPGTFTDADDNILVSSGFVEVNLRDKSGKTISSLDEPASVRFELNPTSWHTLSDRVPDSGQIEVSMFSFDEGSGQWIPEKHGILVAEDGSTVKEDDLISIREDTYKGNLFVKFSTSHFSYFNVDEPVGSHACIKGRLVNGKGDVMASMNVKAEGDNYTGGTPGMTTASDGYFAVGVMKSELASEDIDGDSVEGETFTARLVVAGSAGISTEFTFDTPVNNQKIVSKGGINCVPQDCPCEDLSDVEISIEPPRLCEVTLSAIFQGSGNTDDYSVGDPVSDLKVSGEMVSVSAPVTDAVLDLCKDKPCNGGTTDSKGNVTVVVPLFGNPDKLRFSARWQKKRDSGNWDIYSGKVEVKACELGSVSVAEKVKLEITHFEKQDFGSFILDLFPNNSVAGSDGKSLTSGCQCTARKGGRTSFVYLILLLATVAGMRILRRWRIK